MTDEPAHVALERELALFVRRARSTSERLSREVHPEVDAAAYGLLVRLCDDGPQRPSDLAGHVGVGKATITRQLKPLEALGLIERLQDPDDGRAHRWRLTGKGRERIAVVRKARRERMQSILDSWPEEDVRTLTRLLGRLNAIPPR